MNEANRIRTALLASLSFHEDSPEERNRRIEIALNPADADATQPANMRSRRVMQRIGMTRDPADDFDHPRVPDGSPMKRHVLYRIGREQWRQSTGRASSRP